MKPQIIQFKDVKIGDLIRQENYIGTNKWREVTNIESSIKSGVISLYLGVTAHDTIDTRTQICGYSFDYISVKRG